MTAPNPSGEALMNRMWAMCAGGWAVCVAGIIYCWPLGHAHDEVPRSAALAYLTAVTAPQLGALILLVLMFIEWPKFHDTQEDPSV